VRTPQDSVLLARVGDNWSWRPLTGGAWTNAAVEKLEKLIEAVTEADVVDFASDSLADPKVFALDRPDFIITFAAGKHMGLDHLTPMNRENSRTLRIAIREDGQIFANYVGDSFVYRIGPEVSSAIPMSFNKWRTLALPGFSVQQVRSIKRTIGTTPPLEMKYNNKSLRWTITQAGTDVTPLYAAASIEALVNKLGTLSVANWLDKPDEANKALATPAVIIEVEHESYGEKVADTKVVTTTITLAPLPAAAAPLCYGRHSGVEGSFLIKTETLRDMTADLLIKK
jgi:hypothetical protein